jgi:hypothetical protein
LKVLAVEEVYPHHILVLAKNPETISMS